MEKELGKTINNEVNQHCASCSSARCGPKINIALSTEERDFLRSSGTILLPIVQIGNTNMMLYSLESKCGFVEDRKCRVHKDPRRPVNCGELKAGGEICRQIKESRKTGMGYEFGY